MHFSSTFSEDEHRNTQAVRQGKLMEFNVLCVFLSGLVQCHIHEVQMDTHSVCSLN